MIKRFQIGECQHVDVAHQPIPGVPMLCMTKFFGTQILTWSGTAWKHPVYSNTALLLDDVVFYHMIYTTQHER